MCKHIISYRLRSDLGTAAPQILMLDTDADLERQLSSLRASQETVKLTVFTATQKFERVPSWVEREVVEELPSPAEPVPRSAGGVEIVGTLGVIVPPRQHSTDA